MKRLLLVSLLFATGVAQALVPATGNGVVIADTSGVSQTNSPETVTRFFQRGTIPHYAQAVINGISVLTQCDVKNRWPDGSVKFAIVSFIVPRIDSHGVAVEFKDQTTGNSSGYLKPSDMLDAAYDFEAAMELTGSKTHMTISARAILSAGHLSYWLKGPIVTAVIVEDRANRSYDVNTDGLSGNPLHPIFEAWFYPQNHSVDVGLTLENIWASSNGARSARHQTFALTLATGYGSPTTNLKQSSFKQFAFTRWRRDYWIGGTPAAAKVRFDFNPRYLESTGAYPNWDYTVNPVDINGELSAYSKLQTDYPQRFTLAGYDNTVGGGIASYPQAINVAGEWHYDDWKGLFPSWDALYFFSGDPGLRDEMLTSADLAGRFPIWYREADHNAGSGAYFDAPSTGSLDTYGRVISVNARQQFTASLANWQPGCKNESSDNVNTLTPLDYPAAYGGWRELNTSHIPAFAYMAYTLTGKYGYLDEIQMQAADEIASVTGCFDPDIPYYRQGHLGLADAASTRNTAWQFRDMTYAAFISPDGDPAGLYFKDKLINNLALQEAGHGISQTIPRTLDTVAAYAYGTSAWGKSESSNPSPLGIWYSSTAYGQTKNCANNIKTGYLKSAYANFPEHFMMAVLGMMRQLDIANTTPLLKIFGRRYFHILLDPAVGNPYLIEEYVYPQQTADGQWVSSWRTFVNAYCAPKTGWEAGTPAVYGAQALGALSYLSDIQVDGYSGLDAWKWLKANLPDPPDARWSQVPVGDKKP